MPINPTIGNVITGNHGRYELMNMVTEGNMSWSLDAWNQDTNERVFLKYYKSPTPKVSWYSDYIRYVGELNRRLEESQANQYCVLCKDLFTANPNPSINPCDYLFQAYEFIEGGKDLRTLLDSGHPDWETRRGIAKVFLAAMCKIHEAKVVHCDLKPENVQILSDERTKLGVIPRMIDMDRSIMEDIVAPWTTGDNKEGYVGTPGYFSPEHLRGETPKTASDVFTVAIILCELLCGAHPFADAMGDADQYKQNVLAGNKFAPIGLIGELGGGAGNAQQFEALLQQALSPNPSERPTCKELHQALIKLDRKPSTSVGHAPSPVVTKKPTTTVTPPPPTSVPVLVLTGDIGEFKARISMDVGRGALGSVSSESNYCSRYQFRISRKGSAWSIAPCAGEPPSTMTMVNGEELTASRVLNSGDEVYLQGRSSGRQAMRLKVSLR